jgi:hypothetical protein
MLVQEYALYEASRHDVQGFGPCALATQTLRTGAPLAEVGLLLRHRSQLSTTIYAEVDHTALRRTVTRTPRSTEALSQSDAKNPLNGQNE